MTTQQHTSHTPRQVEQQYDALVSSTAALQNSGNKNHAGGNAEEGASIPPSLQAYEYSTYNRVAAYLQQHAPNLHLLGYDNDDNDSKMSPHLPIFSFLIKWCFSDRRWKCIWPSGCARRAASAPGISNKFSIIFIIRRKSIFIPPKYRISILYRFYIRIVSW